MISAIEVVGMGTYLPQGQLTNEHVARTAGVSEEWILRATGIKTRFTAGPDEAASDLGEQALRSALAATGLEAEQLDLIITTTSTPDELGPATSCRIQHSVGASRAVAFDMNTACSGWLFGVDAVRGWFSTKPKTKFAAVICVDTYTKFLDMSDRATAVLFSDGAVATILARTEEGDGVHDIFLGSDGKIADSIMIPQGGSRNPVVAGKGFPQKIHMDGKDIRDFAFKTFPESVEEILRRNQMTMDFVDMVVAHQPNPVLLSRIADKCGIPKEKLVITGDEVGNIGCACAPYALATAACEKRIQRGDRLLVVAFGAGMTWGSAILTWSGAPVVRSNMPTVHGV